MPAEVVPADPNRPRFLSAMRRAVAAAVERLAPRDRLRLALYHAQDLTLAQTGRTLGEHEATASRQLARTRRAIRKDVEQRLREHERMSGAEVSECFESIVEDAGTLDVAKCSVRPPAARMPVRTVLHREGDRVQKHRDDESVDRVLRQVLPELMTTAGFRRVYRRRDPRGLDRRNPAGVAGGPSSKRTSRTARGASSSWPHSSAQRPLSPCLRRLSGSVGGFTVSVPLAAATAILAIWLALPGSPTDPPAAQEVATSIAENKPAVAPEAPTELNAPNAAAPGRNNSVTTRTPPSAHWQPELEIV